MTENEALDMLRAKLKCMELELLACIGKGCDRKCDNCDCNYAQGNMGEQKEALSVAIQALEKQIEMKRYCDENGCANCPYHNSSINDNRCMNDFIIEME